ncbi:MAG: hypothetical protein AAFQ15_09625 [Pseudomonadota bacterium]
MVGLVSDNPDGFDGLKQYKNTTAKGNSIAKKARIAEALTNAISSNELSLHTVACLGHGEQWHRYGRAFMGSLPTGIVSWSENGFCVDGTYVPAPTAYAMATYAAGLSLICLRAAIWARNIDCKKITVLMDKLPNKDVGDATKLLQVIQQHPESIPIWTDMKKTFGVDFTFGDEWNYRPTAADYNRPGKDHPNAILTDWVAQSVYAAANPAEWLGKSPKATEEHRKSVAGPFFALQENKRIKVCSLNNLITGDG